MNVDGDYETSSGIGFLNSLDLFRTIHHLIPYHVHVLSYLGDAPKAWSLQRQPAQRQQFQHLNEGQT